MLSYPPVIGKFFFFNQFYLHWVTSRGKLASFFMLQNKFVGQRAVLIPEHTTSGHRNTSFNVSTLLQTQSMLSAAQEVILLRVVGEANAEDDVGLSALPCQRLPYSPCSVNNGWRLQDDQWLSLHLQRPKAETGPVMDDSTLQVLPVVTVAWMMVHDDVWPYSGGWQDRIIFGSFFNHKHLITSVWV